MEINYIAIGAIILITILISIQYILNKIFKELVTIKQLLKELRGRN